ncbi:MAG TPA: sigma-70 family RNA polymerase sigma factor [Bacteroidota bacterium]|nr:sigma-70 family RNA polymerase sigma factor [Bacteroidota bacterium]
MQADETALINGVLKRDRRSTELLVERYKDKAMTLASRMLRNREDAEEAVQDAFVRAIRSLPGFEMRSAFSTWFHRIVYNVCVSRLSKNSKEQAVDDLDDASDSIASEDALPDADYEATEVGAIISEEIEKLPSAYAATFTLFFVDEMSYREIVEVTGLPIGTVKARLFRARMIVRDAVARRLGLRRESDSAVPEEIV